MLQLLDDHGAAAIDDAMASALEHDAISSASVAYRVDQQARRARRLPRAASVELRDQHLHDLRVVPHDLGTYAHCASSVSREKECWFATHVPELFLGGTPGHGMSMDGMSMDGMGMDGMGMGGMGMMDRSAGQEGTWPRYVLDSPIPFWDKSSWRGLLRSESVRFPAAAEGDRTMEFAELVIRAWYAGDQKASVLVHSSPAGAMRRSVDAACDLDEIETLRRGCFPQPSDREFSIARMRVADPERLATLLTTALFPAEPARIFADSIARLGPDEGLRLRLCLDERLVDLPWELLRTPDSDGTPTVGFDAENFLALDPRISIVREEARVRPKGPPPQGRDRLAFVGAFWSDSSDRFQVLSEFIELVEACEPISEFLQLRFRPAGKGGLERALDIPSTIFHYSGHVQATNDGDRIARVIDIGDPVGKSEFVDPADLRRLLVRSQCRLAVFNACNSGRWGFVKPLLETGVIPALIGVQGAVTNDGAIAFARALYARLALGLSIDEAMTAGRREVLKNQWPYEWARFMIYLPTDEAVLFPKPEAGERRQKLRDQDVDESQRLLRARPDDQPPPNKITVLFLASNPSDSGRLRLDEENRQIQQWLRLARYRDAIEFKDAWAVQLADIQDLLLNAEPRVLHFAGHGTATATSTTPTGGRQAVGLTPVGAETGDSAGPRSIALVFQDKDGRMSPVPLRALIPTLANFEKLRLLFLNACYSGLEEARELTKHVPFVVGMNTSVPDATAISFAAAFYRAIGYGKSVRHAFDPAVANISLDDLPGDDIPHLLWADGLDPDKEILVEPQ